MLKVYDFKQNPLLLAPARMLECCQPLCPGTNDVQVIFDRLFITNPIDKNWGRHGMVQVADFGAHIFQLVVHQRNYAERGGSKFPDVDQYALVPRESVDGC